MLFSMYFFGALMMVIVLLLGWIAVNLARKKRLPDLRYTPFDHIAGQSNVEFHEMKEVLEEDDENGEGKRRKPRKTTST